jgi:hypothetical protein
MDHESLFSLAFQPSSVFPPSKIDTQPPSLRRHGRWRRSATTGLPGGLPARPRRMKGIRRQRGGMVRIQSAPSNSGLKFRFRGSINLSHRCRPAATMQPRLPRPRACPRGQPASEGPRGAGPGTGGFRKPWRRTGRELRSGGFRTPWVAWTSGTDLAGAMSPHSLPSVEYMRGCRTR